ncbi:hypothetical protein H696_01979 [Fonticula alba]|uniref:RING-type domain-containing protein n=1 Tax=Fonticula alba TaxID=691883 RepID=A0A058ZAR6_FONAL|nr:hypothetical protein H696_01979 [Fonticula alba]KCV71031.1 hypothetical protein H696_01979 [Fonticula alba]|eukprot:XP_009494154.1 hypothetical protein H696_01979 [Fonticula alba]
MLQSNAAPVGGSGLTPPPSPATQSGLEAAVAPTTDSLPTPSTVLPQHRRCEACATSLLRSTALLVTPCGHVVCERCRDHTFAAPNAPARCHCGLSLRGADDFRPPRWEWMGIERDLWARETLAAHIRTRESFDPLPEFASVISPDECDRAYDDYLENVEEIFIRLAQRQNVDQQLFLFACATLAPPPGCSLPLGGKAQDGPAAATAAERRRRARQAGVAAALSLPQFEWRRALPDPFTADPAAAGLPRSESASSSVSASQSMSLLGGRGNRSRHVAGSNLREWRAREGDATWTPFEAIRALAIQLEARARANAQNLSKSRAASQAAADQAAAAAANVPFDPMEGCYYTDANRALSLLALQNINVPPPPGPDGKPGPPAEPFAWTQGLWLQEKSQTTDDMRQIATEQAGGFVRGSIWPVPVFPQPVDAKVFFSGSGALGGAHACVINARRSQHYTPTQ